MSRLGHKWGLTVLLVSLTLCGLANADPLTSLYNTGVDASGTPLPDGTIGDPHYSLVSVPGETTDIRVRTSAGGYPVNPPYIGDDSKSAWIGPNNDTILDGPDGHYDYRTTFDLTGFDPSTAKITGGWTTDNEGVMILLNGHDTGNAPITSATQYSAGFAPFSIMTGFLPGLNTIDFIVNNDGGPTALRVEMTGTAATPLPSTAVAGMALLGGLGMMQFARRTKATVAALGSV
jgi:hypothetical protein